VRRKGKTVIKIPQWAALFFVDDKAVHHRISNYISRFRQGDGLAWLFCPSIKGGEAGTGRLGGLISVKISQFPLLWRWIAAGNGRVSLFVPFFKKIYCYIKYFYTNLINFNKKY
jgi:hypothetical protein